MNEELLANLENAKTIPFAGSEAILAYADLKSATGILYQDVNSGSIAIAVAERIKSNPLLVAAVLADLAQLQAFFKVHHNPFPYIISRIRVAEEVAAA